MSSILFDLSKNELFKSRENYKKAAKAIWKKGSINE